MTASTGRRKLIVRIVVALAASLMLLPMGVAARSLLLDEAAHANAFVAEGQGDLAKNDRAAAVLAFERARWVAPRAELVRSSLDAAGVKDAEPVAARAARVLTSREWFAIAIAAGWASVLGVVYLFFRRGSRGAKNVALGAACAFALAMTGLFASNASSPAIITAADVSLLVAPYAAAGAESSLPSGTMVVTGPAYDDFVHVEDAEGRQGWVPRRSIEHIVGTDGV